MLNTMSYSLPEGLEAEVRSEMEKWSSERKVARIWSRDATVWSGEDEAKWLGWLDIVEAEQGNVQRYREFRSDIENAGFADVLLMGMGGSSLCPEVLAMTFGKCDFHILDSTVPEQVKAVEESLDLEKTLFIVASKSGSTLEPNCFKQYFFELVAERAGRENAGKQFVAITDPGSKMEQIAKDDRFRYIFHGKPEIGGRFSALSAFGMTAAAAMGLDVEGFLNNAAEMVEACKIEDPANNPGALLGTILGVCQKNGRDKLTIFTSPEIFDLGAWLEQLIAESTGKNDIAIIPVDREPILPADHYGEDRIFVSLSVKGETKDEEFTIGLQAIEQAEYPVARIELETIENLGQEFFRWEFATAVAGSIMEINPFNQPDVESAKIEARKLTDEYEKTGELPPEKPFFEEGGVALYTGEDYATELHEMADEESLSGFLEAHLWNLEDGDYFALLAYVAMNHENEELVQQIRTKVLEQNGNATCVGFGPRFLHSTGQAYKGGPNSGVFLQITSDDQFDLPVPGQKYTFGIVKAAQARGDFQVLLDRGRRALRVQIGGSLSVREGLQRILSKL
jgi:transaldolase/glucose-6-phosphate isomerase